MASNQKFDIYKKNFTFFMFLVYGNRLFCEEWHQEALSPDYKGQNLNAEAVLCK